MIVTGILAFVTVITAALLVLAMSFLFDGIDRRIHARMQGRIGPPVAQPYWDFQKLLRKETVIPSSATRSLFLAAPLIAVTSALTGGIIPFMARFFGMSMLGDMVLVMYLLAMPAIMKIIGGAASGSPYGAIGFSREVSMLIAYEIPLVCSVFLVSMHTGAGISSLDIINVQQATGMPLALSSPSMLCTCIVFITCIAPAIGAVPYDNPEAKSEIVHGALVEYSGRGLALMKLARWIKAFSLYFLGSVLFFTISFQWPGETGSLVSGLLAIPVALGLMVMTVSIPRTVMARLRVGQAFKRFWKVNIAFLALATVLISLGL